MQNILLIVIIFAVLFLLTVKKEKYSQATITQLVAKGPQDTYLTADAYKYIPPWLYGYGRGYGGGFGRFRGSFRRGYSGGYHGRSSRGYGYNSYGGYNNRMSYAPYGGYYGTGYGGIGSYWLRPFPYYSAYY